MNKISRSTDVLSALKNRQRGFLLNPYFNAVVTPYGFDPAKKTVRFSLSDNNRTTTHDGASGNNNSEAAVVASTKSYIECYAMGQATASFSPGMAPSTYSFSSIRLSTAANSGFSIRQAGGTNLSGAAHTAVTAWENGEIVSFAVDPAAGMGWVAIAGVWQGAGDPAAGTNPFWTFTPGVSQRFMLGVDTAGSGTASLIGNFKSGEMVYAIPAGFSAWEGAGGVSRIPASNGQGTVLDGVPSSAVLWLEAGDIDSFASSTAQTVANLVQSPADGSAQIDYDFWRGDGVASDDIDPVFRGTPGLSGAFFNFGTAVTFGPVRRLVLKAASNTSFLANLHKLNSQFTLEVWLSNYTGQSGICPVIETSGVTVSGNNGLRTVNYMDVGDFYTNGNKNTIRVMGDTANSVVLDKKSDATIAAGALPQMYAVSIDGTGAGPSFLYRDGAYDPVGAANTWTQALTSTTNGAGRFRVGVQWNNGGNGIHKNNKIYMIRVYNTNLSKAALDALWANTKGRFNR